MEYRYDVFISYKHAEIDSAVAQGLQKKLEHYRVPKEIQKAHGKSRIQRVFRDQEELSVGYDLAAEIEEQLKHSEFLVVLCSRASRKSEWVAKEVDTFLKYHSPQNILPILIDGEPEESFPLRLLEEGEPFAADIRADSKKAVLKKLETEVYRIIAPVLYCHYDELIQRNKRYRMQRILIASMAAFVLLSGFTVYVIRQSIKERKSFMEQLRSESQILTTEAENYIEVENYLTAARYLLRALPDPTSKDSMMRERPFYTPAARLLTRCLGIYATSQAVSGESECTAIYTNDGEIRQVLLGEDEDHLIVDDPYHIHILDTATMEEDHGYRYSDRRWSESKIQTVGETRIVFLDGYTLVCYDYGTDQVVWKKDFLTIVEFLSTPDGERVYVLDDTAHELYLIDAKSGKEQEVQKLDLPTKNMQLSSLSEDGSKILFHYIMDDFQKMICVYDAEKKSFREAPIASSVNISMLVERDELVITGREDSNDKNEVTFTIGLLDTLTGEYVWEHTFDRCLPNAPYWIERGQGVNSGKVLACYGDDLVELNLKDGSVVRQYPVGGKVQWIQWDGDSIRVMTSDGLIFYICDATLEYHATGQDEIEGLMYWPSYEGPIASVSRDHDRNFYLQTEDTRILKYSIAAPDPNIVHEANIPDNRKGLRRMAECADEENRVFLYEYHQNGVEGHYVLMARKRENGALRCFFWEDLLPERDYNTIESIDLLEVKDDKAILMISERLEEEDVHYRYSMAEVDLTTGEASENPVFRARKNVSCEDMLYLDGFCYCCLGDDFGDGFRIVKIDPRTGEGEAIFPTSAISSSYRVIPSKAQPVFYVLDQTYARLYIIEAATGKVQADIDLAEYAFRDRDMSELALAESDDGEILAVAECGGIHIYDRNGTVLATVDYERPIDDDESMVETLGGLSIDPEKQHLYYLAFGKIYQCRLATGETLHDAEIPGYVGKKTASVFHYDTFSYDGGKTAMSVLDIVFEGRENYMSVSENNMCEVFLEEADFGLLFEAEQVYDVDPDSGRIYCLDRASTDSYSTGCLAAFERYTYEDMITMGKEKVENED